MRSSVIRASWVIALLLLTGAPASARPLWQAPGPPYDAWNVTVAPSEVNPQELHVDFDSALLGRRVRNVVWLPDAYLESGGDRSPVVYYLHGTRELAEPLETVLNPGGLLRGNDRQLRNIVGLYHVPLDQPHFLVVVPDPERPSWCGYCWWVNGRNGVGVPAESHLYEELIPLIEAMFRVRTDRGGRGVMGQSMGGSGALIQGFRHPDRFAAIVMTGATTTTDLTGSLTTAFYTAFWAGYLVGQGYGPPATDEIHFRNIEPLTLAPQLIGSNVETIMILGDGCPGHQNGACAGESFNAEEEFFYRTYSEPATARFAELGLPHYFIKREGTHGSHLADSYSRHIIPRLNRIFADPVPDPHSFSYKTVDTEFSIWGYDFLVERPNAEFLNVLGARLDGRSFTLAGTGRADVTTPAAFSPGRSYRVVVSRENGTPSEENAIAGSDGRLTISVPLGEVRTFDERIVLVEAGLFLFPHTRVEVLDTP